MRRILLSTIFFASLAGCAGSGPGNAFRMNRADNVAAASAELKVREEGNGNTAVALRVADLPSPADFRKDAVTYVVWAQEPGGGMAHNIGALTVGKGGQGLMESLTPLKRFDIYITAESAAEARSPSGDRALWASVAHR